ncbi:hypothetical protein POM88_046861 [Heracleum sosnowskyi]|uniref:Sodium/calcium exchanger membrane region domain-containing protein n=1 Tax=Heracleum sosnowskyi TaxID=360622 RepID=A0AAD8M7H6_9APIA|nr:hypothetical protein POM88_046861 [Heracleum sosnowskyi]
MPEDESTGIVDIFSVHSASGTGPVYQKVYGSDEARSCEQGSKDIISEEMHLLSIWKHGIAYIVTKLSDVISCVTGINAYVIAFTVLASGTSWPDLVASKIAAERQLTADSAIANITSSNSVNIYVGIGVPWLIDTLYNFIAYRKPLV